MYFHIGVWLLKVSWNGCFDIYPALFPRTNIEMWNVSEITTPSLVVFYILVYWLIKVSWNGCVDINPVLCPRTVVLILGVALGQYSCPRLNTTILGHNAGLILKHPFNNTIVEIKLIEFVLFPEGKKMFFQRCVIFLRVYMVFQWCIVFRVIVTWIHSFPLVYLWFIYQNVRNS